MRLLSAPGPDDGSKVAGLPAIFGTALICLLLLTTGCASRSVNRAQLKGEIKREILAELRETVKQEPGRPAELSEAERERMKEELRGQILAEIRNYRSAAEQAPDTDSPPEPDQQVDTGEVRGRMLRDGGPLENCRIRIVRMIPVPGALSFFVTYKEQSVHQTATGGEGRFSIADVPAGHYRIKWQPPGETGWIRRLRDDPDFTVKDGKTTNLDPIETHRAVLPR